MDVWTCFSHKCSPKSTPTRKYRYPMVYRRRYELLVDGFFCSYLYRTYFPSFSSFVSTKYFTPALLQVETASDDLADVLFAIEASVKQKKKSKKSFKVS